MDIMSALGEILSDEDVLVEPENAWCGGDCTGDCEDRAEKPPDFNRLTEELEFKNILINELQKSNQELRLKFAQAERKMAEMRVRVDAHCDCCSKSGNEDDRKTAGNDWSSTQSPGMDFKYMSSPTWIQSPDDTMNPYIKVRKWQDTYVKEGIRKSDSTISSIVQERSPNVSLSSNTRSQSPSSGLAEDYVPLPQGDSTPANVLGKFDPEDIKPRSPQKRSGVRTPQQPQANYTEGKLLSTVKSFPDEQIWSSIHHRIGGGSKPFTRTLRPMYMQSELRQSEQLTADHHQKRPARPLLETWTQQTPSTGIRRDDGIVGMLMDDNRHRQ